MTRRLYIFKSTPECPEVFYTVPGHEGMPNSSPYIDFEPSFHASKPSDGVRVMTEKKGRWNEIGLEKRKTSIEINQQERIIYLLTVSPSLAKRKRGQTRHGARHPFSDS